MTDANVSYLSEAEGEYGRLYLGTSNASWSCLQEELAGDDGGSELLIRIHLFVVSVLIVLVLGCGRLSVSFDCIIRLRSPIPNHNATVTW